MAQGASTYRRLILGTVILFVVALLLFWPSRRSERVSGYEIDWREGIGLVEIGGLILDSDRLVGLIDAYGSRDDVRGILVDIDSPGGGVVASDEIYRALKRTREEDGKPVVAYLGSVAASGGYYVACAADSIIAHPASITGSIGVIAEFPVARELLERIGLRWQVLTSGPFKDMGSPFSEPTRQQLAWFQEVIDDTYAQFLDVVVEGRDMTEEHARTYADGRIFTGRQAAGWGFADRMGDRVDAVAAVGRMAGLGEDPRLIEPRSPPGLTLWDVLLGRAGAGDLMDAAARRLGLGPTDGPRVRYLMR
ncbi:MAG: signal peptide peptidase SppA [bacterium]